MNDNANTFKYWGEVIPNNEINTADLVFDYELGRFDYSRATNDLVAVNGVGSIFLWISQTLRTDFNVYESSSENYGNKILNMLTAGYPRELISVFIELELTRLMALNEEITSVSWVRVNFINNYIEISFNITILGVEGNVERTISLSKNSLETERNIRRR